MYVFIYNSVILKWAEHIQHKTVANTKEETKRHFKTKQKKILIDYYSEKSSSLLLDLETTDALKNMVFSQVS